MTSIQPVITTPTITQRISVMVRSRVRIQEVGPSSSPSRYTPRRTSTRATSRRIAPSFTAVVMPAVASTTWPASSVAIAARIGASLSAPSRPWSAQCIARTGTALRGCGLCRVRSTRATMSATMAATTMTAAEASKWGEVSWRTARMGLSGLSIRR